MALPADAPVDAHPAREIAIAALVGLLLFTVGVWNQEPTGFDVRFTLFAQEMLRYGPSFFPTTWGEPYPDYPALSTILIWLPSRLFGEVTRLWVILPTAVAAAATLALTYALVRPICRDWAILSVCLELTTFTFLTEARFTSIDMMITALALACFMLASDARSHDRSRGRWAALCGLLFLGFCLRGPMGIVLPAGVVCSRYAVEQRWRGLLGFGALAAGLLVACCGLMYQVAAWSGGEEFARKVWTMEVAGRVSGISGPGVFYYLVSSLGNYAVAFPFALAVAVALIPRLRRAPIDARLRLAVAMIAWSLVLLIGLSIPEAKKARYLLPIVPAIAILAAYPLAHTGAEEGRALAVVRQALSGLLLLFPALLVLLFLAGVNYAERQGIGFDLMGGAIVGLLVVGQVVSLAIWRYVPRDSWRTCAPAIIAAWLLWAANLLVREPLLVQLHGSRPFVEAIEQVREEYPAQLVLYRMARDNLANHYLVNARKPVRPLLVEDARELARLRLPYFLVVSREDARALARRGAALPPPLFAGQFYGDPYNAYLLAKQVNLAAPTKE